MTSTRSRPGLGLLALLLALFMFLPGQASLPPMDRDESRFAQATRQMIETGDYVDIRYLDQPRWLQPAGAYWLQAAAVTAFGDLDQREIWPHRIPSWLAAIAAVFLTWRIGFLLFGLQAGRLAALLMGACLILNVEARLAKIDAALCAATLAAQWALAEAFMARERGRKLSVWIALAFWTALGLGGLLKGPITLLVTGGTILGLVLTERKIRWLGALRPGWGVPLMLAVAAPWYVAIGLATDGGFFRTALGYSVVGKLAGSHQNHGGPPGYHTLLFPLMFWPGSLFLLAAAPLAWAGRNTAPVRFCLAWIVPALLVFEFSGTKLPHYTLPLMPAAAMLAGAALAGRDGKRLLAAPRAFYPAALLWFGITGVIIAAPFVAAHLYGTGATPLMTAVAAAAGTAAIAALVFSWRGRSLAAAAAAAATSLFAVFNLVQLTPPRLEDVFLSPRIVASAETVHPECREPALVALGYHEPSMTFANGSDTMLARSPAEAAQKLGAAGACGVAVVQDREADAFLAAAAEAGLDVERKASVGGRNYNEGDASAIYLYAPR